MVELYKKFPKLENVHYNAHQRTLGDKIFLYTKREIAPGEEIYFDYSFDYWKWFYDLKKQSNPDTWEKEKIKYFEKYNSFIIGQSEDLKLALQQVHL
jgi:hypothetical protein